jgi:NADH-quinone oxidoreductase subunit M
VAGIEWAAWSPLVLLALAIGLAPALVLATTADPIAALTEALR